MARMQGKYTLSMIPGIPKLISVIEARMLLWLFFTQCRDFYMGLIEV